VVSLTEAQTTVREAVIQVQAIAAAVKQQSASSKSITTLVNDVSGIAMDNNELVTKVDDELKGLMQKANELLELVSEFRS
jgi:methyl-accepting chemotaxis protein